MNGELDVEGTADAIVTNHLTTDATLERLAFSRWAQAVAAEIIEQYQEDRDVLARLNIRDDFRMSRWSTVEDADFYVYTDNRSTKVSYQRLYNPIPIRALGEYRRVVEFRLDPNVKGCQLGVSIFCRPRTHNQLFALKRGDNICVAKACAPCMHLFELPDPQIYVARPVGPASSYGKSGGQYPDPLIVRPEPDMPPPSDDPWGCTGTWRTTTDRGTSSEMRSPHPLEA